MSTQVASRRAVTSDQNDGQCIIKSNKVEGQQESPWAGQAAFLSTASVAVFKSHCHTEESPRKCAGSALFDLPAMINADKAVKNGSKKCKLHKIISH